MTSQGSKRWITGPHTLDATTTLEHLGYACKIQLVGGTAPNVRTYDRIHLVEAQISGRWRELDPVSLGELRDSYSPMAGYSEPKAWSYEALRSEPTTTDPAFCLIIAPDCDLSAIPIRVYGTADTNITDADATTIYLDAPGFEWIIWNTVIDIAARDNDSNGTASIAMQERAKQEEQIRNSIRTERRNTVQRRDVFHGNPRYSWLRRF